MAKFIRYSLAGFCLTASVGCLALWGWNVVRHDMSDGAGLALTSTTIQVEVIRGIAVVWTESSIGSVSVLQTRTRRLGIDPEFAEAVNQRGLIGAYGPAIYFPLWYPALVSALVGVGILRIHSFTIRSALIATTIVALLLGMVVAI